MPAEKPHGIDPDQPPPRFLPDEPFPGYAFTPGRDPHPVRDPRGHSHGVHAPAPPVPDPGHWERSRDYLRGIDLFNAGYYWEAHEAWEGLWNACGRVGPAALLLQGLIALAAAGVKLRQNNMTGASAHAERALDLFEGVGSSPYMGLDLCRLSEAARRLGQANFTAAPEPAVLGFFLQPAR